MHEVIIVKGCETQIFSEGIGDLEKALKTGRVSIKICQIFLTELNTFFMFDFHKNIAICLLRVKETDIYIGLYGRANFQDFVFDG